MQRVGTATLPLHGGRAPRWLFDRMVKLAGAVVEALVEDIRPDGVLRRLGDPFWFQAFGCLLGFDWHSSGVTTTVCGALKEALRGRERATGLAVAGGKGAASRRTPHELAGYGDRFGVQADRLIYASRLSAKVDSNAVQDGYQLYHHTFFATLDGQWAVVQQGMRDADRTARRYHWLGETISSFVEEPHAAVCCDRTAPALNFVAAESAPARGTITGLSHEPPHYLIGELARAVPGRRPPAAAPPDRGAALDDLLPQRPYLVLPAHHAVTAADIRPERLAGALLRTYEAQAASFEALLGLPKVGAKTLRALALLSEVLAGTPVSWRDPARFAFAHGGKDGHPFPVDRVTYDRTIAVLEDGVRRARLGEPDRLAALRRLHRAVCPQ
jgi:hypothetical protein